MRTLMMTLLILTLAGGASAADRAVTVTPLTEPPQSIGLASPSEPCFAGNNGAPGYAITDWIWGQESYATVFQAQQEACACPSGFTVDQVHFFMNFSVTDVPVTFDASVGFHEAVFDQTAGCSVPGPVICTSPTYQVTITNPGLYDIALPMGPGCPCAFFNYDYAVSINFPNPFPATQRPDAVTDVAPVGCTSYNDYGTGWTDTFSFGFPGELVMYADLACCDPAVPTETPTWGSLKSLFR